MEDKVWQPNWLSRLEKNDINENDFHIKPNEPDNIIDDTIEKVDDEIQDRQEIMAAKTRLTQVIDTTMDSALVLEGTLLDDMGQSIQTWTGSAFLIQPNIAITNAHTVVLPDTKRGEKALHIVSLDGEEFYKINILAQSKEIDVSVIEIVDFPGHSYLSLGNSDILELGEMIVVLGAPEGWQNSASVGYISNVDKTLEGADSSWENVVFTDAYIASGSSGAAAVNMEGKVIGVVMGIIGSHSKVGVGINALIPINKVTTFLRQLNISYE